MLYHKAVQVELILDDVSNTLKRPRYAAILCSGAPWCRVTLAFVFFSTRIDARLR